MKCKIKFSSPKEKFRFKNKNKVNKVFWRGSQATPTFFLSTCKCFDNPETTLGMNLGSA